MITKTTRSGSVITFGYDDSDRQFSAEEKHRLLNFVHSNSTWRDGRLHAGFRQPFDMIAETATAAVRMEAEEGAEAARYSYWLPFVGRFRTVLALIELVDMGRYEAGSVQAAQAARN